MVEAQSILQGIVGSTLHGLAVNDGHEDTDVMGVYVERPERILGLHSMEHFDYRTAAKGVRSMAGDVDLVFYSLRKWVRLALKCNPTILTLLYLPENRIIQQTALGEELQALAPYIVSRKALGPYLGYMQNQRRRLVGIQGQKDTNRPELIAKYGFDTKYAMHMLRLGYQGIELLSTGKLTFPMKPWIRDRLRDVRTGGWAEAKCLRHAEWLEAEIKSVAESSPLPEGPDEALVEAWMVHAYRESWGETSCLRATLTHA